jgi:hypothetical protein
MKLVAATGKIRTSPVRASPTSQDAAGMAATRTIIKVRSARQLDRGVLAWMSAAEMVTTG